MELDYLDLNVYLIPCLYLILSDTRCWQKLKVDIYSKLIKPGEEKFGDKLLYFYGLD